MKRLHHAICVLAIIAGPGSACPRATAAERLLESDGCAAVASDANRLLRRQYERTDSSFCYAGTCVDYSNDGRREILFASRETGQLQMLNAADGSVRWSKKLEGEQQSISAFDLDDDGTYEILYSVSNPGRLYVLDGNGNTRRYWDAQDSKLGNSPVIFDADGDGILDGYFGSRAKYLIRLNMRDLTLIRRRSEWIQCGCHTSAMDVDGDGRWDLFAGVGDDSRGEGVLHRFDPITLDSVWAYKTNDNGSSADAVLADIDGDGQVEIIKSVDNYAADDAHDAVYAFETDGTMLWKVEGLSGEDSPNVADLDNDGAVEIVGMTFGGEVYCLDAKGRLKWRNDLRPELDDSAHAYMTPILADVNGDPQLEILAMTNGGWNRKATGIIAALSPSGETLDRLDVGGARYWGEAFYVNVDEDPFMELVVSGSGGVDVIETRGFGPDTEHFQRRRTYQRLNTVPWAYEDSFFIYRGEKQGVENQADSLVLGKTNGRHRSEGRFTTALLTPPPRCRFENIEYGAAEPQGSRLRLNVLSRSGERLLENVSGGQALRIDEPVRLEFALLTSRESVSPKLDWYRLSFDLAPAGK